MMTDGPAIGIDVPTEVPARRETRWWRVSNVSVEVPTQTIAYRLRREMGDPIGQRDAQGRLAIELFTAIPLGEIRQRLVDSADRAHPILAGDEARTVLGDLVLLAEAFGPVGVDWAASGPRRSRPSADDAANGEAYVGYDRMSDLIEEQLNVRAAIDLAAALKSEDADRCRQAAAFVPHRATRRRASRARGSDGDPKTQARDAFARVISDELRWSVPRVVFDGSGAMAQTWEVRSLRPAFYAQIFEHWRDRSEMGFNWCDQCGGVIFSPCRTELAADGQTIAVAQT